MRHRIYILVGVILIFLAGIAVADVYFSDPVKSGNTASRFVEVHSVKSCSIIYKNTTGSPVAIDAAKFYIAWSPANVKGGTISFSNANATFQSFTPTGSAGRMYVDMFTAPGVTVPVAPGATLALVNISYTVENSDGLDGSNLGMVWDSGNTTVVKGTGNDYTGSVLNYTQLTDPTAVTIVKSAPPQDGASAISGIADPATGNTLNITSADNATDDRSIGGKVATTYYDSGAKCRYRIRFNELPDPAAADVTDVNLLSTDVPGLSEIQTAASSAHTGLVDGVRYFYKSLAKDDTLNHNEEGAGGYSQNGFIVKAIPHDHNAPPPFSTPAINTANKTFSVPIAPTALDGGSYLVAIKVGTNQENSYGSLPAKPGDASWWWNVDRTAILYNANHFNGTSDDAAITGFTSNSGSLNGWTLIGKKTGTFVVNQDTFTTAFPTITIENGVNYYVAVIACDAATATQPGNQGYNWWTDWQTYSAKPGVHSNNLQQFLALSSGEVGSIMFNWTNPADVSSGLGGVRIVYTTTPDAWTSLTPDSMLAVEYAAADMDITAIAANSKIMSALSQTDPATINSPGSLTAHQIYYFRAFTFNDPVQRLYSSPGNDYAALPNQGGGGGPVTLTFNLKKSESTKLVVCPITVPPNLRDSTGATLADTNGLVRASQLVSVINGQAVTPPAVIVLGKYDPTSTTGSVAYDPSGTGTDFTIAPGEGLQVYVNQDFTLTLTGAQ